MAEQDKLPKPQKDLPLPEKDLPATRQELSRHAQAVTFLKSKWLIPIVLIVLLIFGLSGFLILKNNTNKQVACTQEAKLCPDGSYVSRSGPKCEFSTCPQIADSKKDCLSKGGTWQKWGLIQKEYCQIPAKDAGKPCTDGSQCSYGKCITNESLSQAKCAIYKSTFGCYSIVENGKVQQALCVD